VRRLRVIRAAAVVLACAFCAVPAALADGDPASDVLPTADVYFPLATPSPSAESALSGAVRQVYAHDDRVKVAVIAQPADLGSIPSLFDKPNPYAHFLGEELTSLYVGPLLIVQPSGFGIWDGGRSTAAAQRVLAGLAVDRSSSSSLTESATTAVERLEAAGALHSPDVKAPYVYPDPVTLHPGTAVRLTFRVLDDSEHASATITISAGARTLATLPVTRLDAVYSKLQSVDWTVPHDVPPEGVRLCLRAVDPSGNRSPVACEPVKVAG
jgi:hypothetical protein